MERLKEGQPRRGQPLPTAAMPGELLWHLLKSKLVAVVALLSVCRMYLPTICLHSCSPLQLSPPFLPNPSRYIVPPLNYCCFYAKCLKVLTSESHAFMYCLILSGNGFATRSYRFSKLHSDLELDSQGAGQVSTGLSFVLRQCLSLYTSACLSSCAHMLHEGRDLWFVQLEIV